MQKKIEYAESKGFTFEIVQVPQQSQNLIQAREARLENNILPNHLCGTAIIVEPRLHAALGFVVHNIAKNVPVEWDIIVVHGSQNATFAHEIVRSSFGSNSSGSNSSNNDSSNQRIIYFKRISVFNLTPRAYSNLFVRDPFIYQLSQYENLLIFQTDSMILNNDRYNHVTIFDFVNMPYVGSPIGSKVNILPMKNPRFKDAGRYFFNGGFSFRKKSLSISAIRDPVARNAGYGMEDWVIASHAFRKSTKRKPYPTQQEAARFAAMWHLHMNRHPFGIHQYWKSMIPNHKQILIKAHPEVQMLLQLQTSTTRKSVATRKPATNRKHTLIARRRLNGKGSKGTHIRRIQMQRQIQQRKRRRLAILLRQRRRYTRR